MAGREGVSEEAICSHVQPATVRGARCAAAHKTKGTSTLMELNSCWGASGGRDNRQTTNGCIIILQMVVSGRKKNIKQDWEIKNDRAILERARMTSLRR